MNLFGKGKKEEGNTLVCGDKLEDCQSNLPIKILLDTAEYFPKKATEGSACYDVKARRIDFNDDGLVICYLGFKTEIPLGFKGEMVPRSNLTKYAWVMQNSPAQMDSDFRGEWQVRFRPIPIKQGDMLYTQKFPYEVGDSVAQIYFEKEEKVDFIPVKELSKTKRGEGGFGHTGK